MALWGHLRNQIGSSGLALLKQWEGLRLKSYKDSGGVWTIGYGHTPSMDGEEIGQNEAERLLRDDLTNPVNLFAANASLTDGQFDALVCFVFNVGHSAYMQSTMSALIREHRWFDATREFTKWHFVKSERSRGLMARRLAEATLFCSDEFLS